jgi:hypothetical protein
MKAKLGKNKIAIKNVMNWLLLMVLLLGIPVFLIYISIFRYYHTIEQNELLQYKMEHQQALNLVKPATNPEVFYCGYFYNNFLKLSLAKAEEIDKYLGILRKTLDNEIDYLIWDNRGNVQYKTFKDNYTNNQWQSTFYALAPLAPQFARIKPAWRPRELDMKAARAVLGPQFLEDTISYLRKPMQFSLGWPDSSREKPAMAAYRLENCTVLILFKYEALENLSPIKIIAKQAKEKHPHLNIAIIEKNKEIKVVSDNKMLDENFEGLIKENSKNGANGLMVDANHYYTSQYLTPTYTLVTHKPKGYPEQLIRLYSALGASLYFLLMSPFLYYTFKTILLKTPVAASIRLKLAFLICFATGIPLIAMLIITQEHNHHKTQTLLVDAHKTTADSIRGFDKRYQAFVKKKSLGIDSFYEAWKERVKSDGLDFYFNNSSMEQLLKDFHMNRAFIISSSTNQIFLSDGLVTYNGSLENLKVDQRRTLTKTHLSKVALEEITLINLIGKKILNELNKQEMEQHIIAKLELFTESILQRTFIDLTNELLMNKNEIKIWGFGDRLNLTYFKFLPVYSEKNYDYMITCFWKLGYFQDAFLQDSILEVNRSIDGIKLTTFDIDKNQFFGNLKDSDGALANYAHNSSEKISEEIETITYHGQEYLILSMVGNYLNNHKIIALYPLSNINKVIDLQRKDLGIYVLLSLMLSIGLSHLLAKSFLVPLSDLTKGALAIESRDFDYRIKISGKDEFNEVGEIFNHVMVGLAEIETAKVVQESLYPPSGFEQNHFEVFGKSIPMSGIGGDYFDIFPIDENRFVVLIGDVAGHGVGAALIMAMAKAGILCHEELQGQPSKILQLLHELILNSKTKKQRKIMTFQYIVVNSLTGEIIFANAGGCSPILYKLKDNSTSELVYPAPVLGAFKKTIYEEHHLILEPNDSLVLYTDGIVEARNLDKEVLGYKAFQNIIKDSYANNTETYYDNILAAYKDYISTGPDEDDITLIVMSFNELKTKDNIDGKSDDGVGKED